MRISKWVDLGAEVDVLIDATDITAAMSEAFASVTDDRLGEEGPNMRDVLRAFNCVGEFFRGLTDEHIAKLNDAQRKAIGEYLRKATDRFGVPGESA